MQDEPEEDVSPSMRGGAGRLRILNQARRVLVAADDLYRPYSCPASAECCQLSKTGRQPWLWPVEWALITARLEREGRPIPAARSEGACALLDADGRRCTVYQDRPFGCRTFFCHRASGPARQPLEATNALQRKIESVSARLDPDCSGPRPLLELLANARTRP
jgi:Fe-S-cluster containining protein